MKIRYQIEETVSITPEETRCRSVNRAVDLPFEIAKFLTIIEDLSKTVNGYLKDAINDILHYFLNQSTEEKFTDFKKLSKVMKKVDNELSNDEKKYVLDYILKKNQEYINNGNLMCDRRDFDNYHFKYHTNDEIVEKLSNKEVDRITYKYEIKKSSLNLKEKKLYVDMANFYDFVNKKYKSIYRTIDGLYFNCPESQLYDIQSIIEALKKLEFSDYLCEIIMDDLENQNKKTEIKIQNRAIKERRRMESTKIEFDEDFVKETNEKVKESLDKFIAYMDFNERKLSEALNEEQGKSSSNNHSSQTLSYQKELQIHLLLIPTIEYVRHLDDEKPYFYNSFLELSDLLLMPEVANSFTSLEKTFIVSYLTVKNSKIIKESKKGNMEIKNPIEEQSINYEAYLKLDEIYSDSKGLNEIDINDIIDNLKIIGVKEELAKLIKKTLIDLYHQQLKKERKKNFKDQKESTKKDTDKQIGTSDNSEPKVSSREKKKIYYNLQSIFDFDNMEARHYLSLDKQIECIKNLNKIGLSHLVENFFLTMYNYNKELIEQDDNIILKIIDCDKISTYFLEFINLGLDKYTSLLEPFFTKAYAALREKNSITYYQVMYNKVLYYKEKYKIDMSSIEEYIRKLMIPESNLKYIEDKEMLKLFIDDLPKELDNDITYEKEKALELSSKE